MSENQLLLKVYEPAIHAAASTVITCDSCNKNYKTNRHLMRHKLNKHSKDEMKKHYQDTITEAALQTLVKESQNALSMDTSYPDIVCQAIKNYNFTDHGDCLLLEIEKMLKNINPEADVKKFYSSFHSVIIMHSTMYFRQLRPPMCTLLATKLADNILTLFWPQDKPIGFLNPSSFSDKELNGIQFVAGYVVSKLLKKAMNSVKSESIENQAIISILNAAQSLDVSNLTLMDALNNSGLCAINLKCLNIFVIAEKTFRRQTRTRDMQHAIRNRYEVDINISSIVTGLTKDVELISNFNSIVAVSSYIPCNEDKMRLLEKMLHLYLRVRTFTLAKDLTRKLGTKMKIVKVGEQKT